jgi:hypothetical protein
MNGSLTFDEWFASEEGQAVFESTCRLQYDSDPNPIAKNGIKNAMQFAFHSGVNGNLD